MTLMNRPRAERVLDAAGLDGLLATSLENVYYLTHVWVESQVGLPRQAQFYAAVARNRLDTPAIACGINEMGNVLANAPAGTAMVPYGKFYRFVEPGAKLSDLDRQIKEWVIDGLGKSRASVAVALAEALDGLGLARGRVAYDERGLLTEEVKAEVQKLLPGLRLVPGWATFRQIRAVKTAVELQRMRAVLELNERSIMAAMGVAKPGATELEMVAEYERTVVTAGGRPSITQIFFGGHGSTGYVNSRNATLTAGEVDPVRHRLLSRRLLVGHRAELLARAARRPGRGSSGTTTRSWRARRRRSRPCARVSRRARCSTPGWPARARPGIPHYDRSHIGHGAGLEIYDIPLLGPNDHTPLEAGMVFQVELPYYELGFPGLQIEDTVLVGEHGSQILGHLDRSFRVVSH